MVTYRVCYDAVGIEWSGNRVFPNPEYEKQNSFSLIINTSLHSRAGTAFNDCNTAAAILPQY